MLQKEQQTTFSDSWLFLTHIGRVVRASNGQLPPNPVNHSGPRALQEAPADWNGESKPSLVFTIAGFTFALRAVQQGNNGEEQPKVEGILLKSPVPGAECPRPINVYVTSPGGWVFGNLAEPGKAVPEWKDYFGGLEEGQFAGINWDEYTL